MDQLPNARYSFKLPHLDVDGYQFGEEVNAISKKFAKDNSVIPVDDSEKILTVCMGIPTVELLQILEKKTGKIIRVFTGCKDKINEAININYN